ncbi:MAG: hypothetical protein EPN70_21465 [Paraburkholderia sp.]|nr:MAG: hypothetical protein EPN70_21465 [Paraburkholderia sp.]
MFDGNMTYEHSGNAPTYAPNSSGRSWAEQTGLVEDDRGADGDMVRSAYTLHAEDDDFGQAGDLVRRVYNDDQRMKLVEQMVASLSGVRSPVRERVFEYWKNIDPDVGRRIEALASGVK